MKSKVIRGKESDVEPFSRLAASPRDFALADTPRALVAHFNAKKVVPFLAFKGQGARFSKVPVA